MKRTRIHPPIKARDPRTGPRTGRLNQAAWSTCGDEVRSRAMFRAIKGCWGNMWLVSRRLGIPRTVASDALAKSPGSRWDACRRRFTDEGLRVGDESEARVVSHMRQGDDLQVSLKAATFLLQHRRPETYGERREIKVNKDARVTHVDARVDVTAELLASMPLDLQRAILEAAERAQGKPVPGEPPKEGVK